MRLYPVSVALAPFVGQGTTVLENGHDQGGQIAAAQVMALIDVALDPVEQAEEFHLLAHVCVERDLCHRQGESDGFSQVHGAEPDVRLWFPVVAVRV